jgi:lipid-binding SYLF domain-containing protein
MQATTNPMPCTGRARRRLFAALAAGAVLLTAGHAGAADSRQSLQGVVDDAQATIRSFRSDTSFPDFNQRLASAKAVYIVPTLLKAGFILGAEGGRGVLMVRDNSAMGWSQPIFFGMGSASFGFQAGVQKSETVFLIFTDKGLQRLLEDKVKLGADAGIAVATIGGGVEGSVTTNVGADILAYSRAQGLYGGLSFEGAIVEADDEANRLFYGRQVTPAQIIHGQVSESGSTTTLRRTLKLSSR